MALGANGALKATLTRYRTLQQAREVSLARGVTAHYQATGQLVDGAVKKLLLSGADALKAQDIGWLKRAPEVQAFRDTVFPWLDGLAQTTMHATLDTQRASVTAGAADGWALLRVSMAQTALEGRTLETPHVQALAQRLERPALRQLFARWPDTLYQQFSSTLKAGFALGLQPNTIAATLRDVYALDYGRALTVSRTEGLRAYRAGTLASYRANDTLVDGWVWVADLSAATCAACIALNGTVHDLSEELDDHVNGRCAQAPHLAAVNGQAIGPTFPDGADWLSEQDDATQRSILGPTRYALYAQDQLELSAVVATRTSSAWGSSIGIASLSEMGVSADTIAAALDAQPVAS